MLYLMCKIIFNMNKIYEKPYDIKRTIALRLAK